MGCPEGWKHKLRLPLQLPLRLSPYGKFGESFRDRELRGFSVSFDATIVRGPLLETPYGVLRKLLISLHCKKRPSKRKWHHSMSTKRFIRNSTTSSEITFHFLFSFLKSPFVVICLPKAFNSFNWLQRFFGVRIFFTNMITDPNTILSYFGLINALISWFEL